MKKLRYVYLLFLISILWIETTYTSQKNISCETTLSGSQPILKLPSQPKEHLVNRDQSKNPTHRNTRRIVVSPKDKYDPYKHQHKHSFDANTRIRFNKKERRKIEQQVERANNELRRKDGRPPFTEKRAYEQWLSEQQKSNTPPHVPYGYVYHEKRQKDGSSSFEIKIRPVPQWIKYPDFLTFNLEAWQKYTKWAKNYRDRNGKDPLLYSQNVKSFMIHVIKVRPDQKETLFVQGLGLKNLLYTLGHSQTHHSSKLLDMIENLNGHDFWIDGGTGQGFVIQDAIQLLSETRPQEDLPSITGITYNSHRDSAVFENSQKHKIWKSRLFEEIPVSDFEGKKAKLITDFHGIFLYSSQPDQVMNKYLQLLSKDGSIVIVYKRENYTVIKENNKSYTFAEWLSSKAPSLQIETGLGVRKDKNQDTTVHYMIIRNPSGEEINLPPLTLSLSLHNSDVNDSPHKSSQGDSHVLQHSDRSLWSVSRILRPQDTPSQNYIAQ